MADSIVPLIPPDDSHPEAMPATDDGAKARARMVDELIARGCVLTPAVASALRRVPRHLFVPGVSLNAAYADEAIVTKWEDTVPVSSSSQPAMVAIMLDQLAVEPGMRVLEVGAGTGYNAALLATLVGASGHVTTIDIDEDIAAKAGDHLKSAGFGLDRVTVVCGDGALGWPDGALYDRIVLTVGAWDVAPAWREQLSHAGRLVLPLALRTVQMSIAFDRGEGGVLVAASMRPCGFMRLRGPFAGPEAAFALGGKRHALLLAEPPFATAERLTALLASPPRQRAMPGGPPDLLSRVIAVMGPHVATLFHGAHHPVLGQHSVGIVSPEGDSACFLSAGHPDPDAAVLVEYGAATAALQCVERVSQWRTLGSPPISTWQCELALDREHVWPQQPVRFLIPKHHSILAITLPPYQCANMIHPVVEHS